MAIRNILTGGDPTLGKKSREIKDFGGRLHELLDDMRETMTQANGLGLAAPQVGVLRRAALIIHIDMESEDYEEKIIELINPKIIAKSGTQEASEGCLSIPGVYGIVCRPELVKLKAQDRFGNPFEIMCKGVSARAACHEIDHLDGIVFTSIAERILTEEELDMLHAEKKRQQEPEAED